MLKLSCHPSLSEDNSRHKSLEMSVLNYTNNLNSNDGINKVLSVTFYYIVYKSSTVNIVSNVVYNACNYFFLLTDS